MPLAGALLGLLGLLGPAAAEPPPSAGPSVPILAASGGLGGGAACLDGSPGALCLRAGSGQRLWQQPGAFPCASRCKADDEQPMLSGPAWRDPSLPIEKRQDDLMPRHTPADLVAQLGGTLHDHHQVFEQPHLLNQCEWTGPGIGDIRRPNLTLPGVSFGMECLSGVGNILLKNGTGGSAFPNPVNLVRQLFTILM